MGKLSHRVIITYIEKFWILTQGRLVSHFLTTVYIPYKGLYLSCLFCLNLFSHFSVCLSVPLTYIGAGYVYTIYPSRLRQDIIKYLQLLMHTKTRVVVKLL